MKHHYWLVLSVFSSRSGPAAVGTYQPEGAQDAEPLHIRQSELHEAEAHDDAVEDVPARLEVVVRVQGDDLQNHLRCEDPRENLREHKHRGHRGHTGVTHTESNQPGLVLQNS